MQNENLLPYGGAVYYWDRIFSTEEAGVFFNQLRTGIQWAQRPISIFGKEILQPRLTAFYGDQERNYTYSSKTMEPLAWTEILIKIKDRVEEKSGIRFTSALLNFYRNGRDSMGWHRDNEKELGKNPVIASVSFGADREFRLREYQKKKDQLRIRLNQGSLLLMKGECQHRWEHCLPKTKMNNVENDERINITFRIINER